MRACHWDRFSESDGQSSAAAVLVAPAAIKVAAVLGFWGLALEAEAVEVLAATMLVRAVPLPGVVTAAVAAMAVTAVVGAVARAAAVAVLLPRVGLQKAKA
jgi:hypothetical protein